MTAVNTKCVIRKAPECLTHLIGRDVAATDKSGARGTGSQGFSFEGGLVFGNADTGVEVTEKN